MNGVHAALTGRVGAEPELRYSGAGKPMLSFSVLVDERVVAIEGRPAAEGTWVRATVWDDLAEQLAGELHKGSSVYAEGRLRLDRWVGQDGAARSGLSLSAWRCEVHGQLGPAAPRRGRRP